MDIVEQLRSNADERLAVWQVVKTMNEAADEIERLRGERWNALKELEKEVLASRFEIERLREALKETLAVARRNEIGDYIQRAETALQQKDK